MSITIPRFRQRNYFNSDRFFMIRDTSRSKGGIREIKIEHGSTGTLVCCKELDGTLIGNIPSNSPFILRLDEVRFLKNTLAKYAGRPHPLEVLVALNAGGDAAMTMILLFFLLVVDEHKNPLLFRSEFLESFIKELISVRT